MSVALEGEVFDVAVPVELEHAAEVGVLLLSAAHFEVGVAGGEEDGWEVGCADMVEGCEFVAGGLGHGDALLGADGEVGDALSADGDESAELAVVAAVALEPAGVHADHAGEVGTGGVSGDEDLGGVAAVVGDVLEDPGDGGGRVVDAGLSGGAVGLGEAVSAGDDGVGVLAVEGEFERGVLGAAGESAAVEPDDGGEASGVLGDGEVELAAGDVGGRTVVEGGFAVGDVLGLHECLSVCVFELSGLSHGGCGRQEGQCQRGASEVAVVAHVLSRPVLSEMLNESREMRAGEGLRGASIEA